MAGKIPSTSRSGVLAAGHWIIDHVKMIDTWPAQDALATIIAQTDGNGGCAYNLLKDLAKLGCGFPLFAAGLLGRDADAATILEDCDAHRINRAGLQQTDAAPTSYTDVMTVNGTGRRTFFHQRGANALLGEEHIELDQSSARIFHLGYLALLDRLDAVDPSGRTGASKLLEKARALGMITVAELVSNETGEFPAIINPSLPYTDYLILNEYEAARLTGVPVPDSVNLCPAWLAERAAAILARGVRRGVVIHFKEGSVCGLADGRVLQQASVRMPPELIKGAAGAGDAFSAGFILGMHEGWETERALELAVCSAAASLRDPTCSAAIEPWQECLRLGKQFGFYKTNDL